MATSIRWIYPPNWDGTYETMYGFNRGIVQLTATAETEGTEAQTVVTLDTLVCPNGNKATRVAVDSIVYDVGFSECYLYYDDEYDTPIASLSGVGKIKFPGGLVNPDPMTEPETDFTGDILLTTTIIAGLIGTYNIILTIRPKE